MEAQEENEESTREEINIYGDSEKTPYCCFTVDDL